MHQELESFYLGIPMWGRIADDSLQPLWPLDEPFGISKKDCCIEHERSTRTLHSDRAQRSPIRTNAKIETQALGSNAIPAPATVIRPVMTPVTAEGSRHVLLILEDFDELRDRFARPFARRGYDIFSSATLRDALMIAKEEAPTTIIVNYALSGDARERYAPRHGGHHVHPAQEGASAVAAIERLRDAMPGSYIMLVGAPYTSSLEESAMCAGASRVVSDALAPHEIDEIAGRM